MLTGRLPLLIGLLVITAPAAARADRTDDYVAAQMAAFRLPGLSLAVIQEGRIIKAAGYGLADVQRKLPATPETVYKIGSVSKQFVATGIMLLVEEGRLGIDDPVTKVLNMAPPAWAPITLRHLLTHTSGLIRESPGFQPSRVQADADVIEAAYPAPLRFGPGEKWGYSNVGYFALAEIIRKVTGRPWTEYLDEKVFRPAGMNATRPTNAGASVPLRALGYTGNDNGRAADDWPALRPSGAFQSTVLDLAKWDAVLDTDRIVSRSVRQPMWTPVQLRGGTTASYGLGWHVDSVRGRKRVWHGGGLPGFAAHYARFVDDGLTVIALANGDDVDLQAIVNGVAAVYLPSSGPAKTGSSAGSRP